MDKSAILGIAKYIPHQCCHIILYISNLMQFKCCVWVCWLLCHGSLEEDEWWSLGSVCCLKNL